MAEVLGIVAGGAGLASLAIQIFDDAQKIKELYSGIRDAPTEFKSLLDEIQLFGTVLALFANDSERRMTNAEFASAQSQVVRQCQGLYDELHPILIRLSTSLIGRQRAISWITVKSIFQKKKIEQMLIKLERAKSTLMLARLLDMTANPPPQQVPLQTESVPGPFKKSNTSSTKKPTEAWSIAKGSSYYLGFGTLTLGQLYSHSAEEDGNAAARFAFASWFLDWAFTITSKRRNGILNISLQPKCLVKGNAPIFLACASGDGKAVADLIAGGKASPFDTTLNGITPLAVAAAWRQPDICRKLIDLGADTSALTEADAIYLLPLNPLALACGRFDPNDLLPSLSGAWPELIVCYFSSEGRSRMRDTLRVLVEHGKAEVEQNIWHSDLGRTRVAFHGFSGSLDDFLWLTAENRVALVDDELQAFYADTATSLSNFSWSSLELIQAAMNKVSDPTLLTISGRPFTPLYGLFAMLLFYAESQKSIQDTLKLIQRTLEAGDDIHGSNIAASTPLGYYCIYFSIDSYLSWHPRSIPLDGHDWSFGAVATWCTRRLKLWADFLRLSGRDLHEYVRIEQEKGTEEWRTCDTDFPIVRDNEYIQSLLIYSRICLDVVTHGDGEEILDIRLEYATKKKRFTMPGEWVEEEAQASASEDADVEETDEDDWTLHYPYRDDEAQEFYDNNDDEYAGQDDDDDADNADNADEDGYEIEDGEEGEEVVNGRKEEANQTGRTTRTSTKTSKPAPHDEE